MRYMVIPYSIYFRKDLRPNSKLLYGYIMSLSAKSGIFYATNEKITNDLGIGTTTINTTLKELENLNLIKIEYTKSNYRRIIAIDSMFQAKRVREYHEKQKLNGKRKVGNNEPEWLDDILNDIDETWV